MLPVVSGLVLGFTMGMRHAFEPDHLAAVTTLVTRHRSPWAGAVVGVFWGTGHTIALLVVGLILAALHTAMPEHVARMFELAVAVMLIILGLRSMIIAVRQGQSGPTHTHHHGEQSHEHQGPVGHLHVGRWTIARQPLMVGLMHGLAGSGALSALAVASMPSITSQIAYMVLFGLGSILGMALLTGLAGLPLSKLPSARQAGTIVSWLSGAISFTVGVWWGWPLAFGA